jgi:transposase-like protein
MSIICPSCSAITVKKNGHIHNGKQNHRCLVCGRQFVIDPEKKLISKEHKALIRQALFERVSLEGICRIFSVSMPWLLRFIEKIIDELPENLNASVVGTEELDLALLELDEQWSYVQNKKNQQWLWLVLDKKTRQVLGMHVGKRTRKSADILLSKLPEEIKKKPSFLQIYSQSTLKSFLGGSISLLARERGKPITLKDLTSP